MITSAGKPDDANVAARNPRIEQQCPQVGNMLDRWLMLSDHPIGLGGVAQDGSLLTKATLVFEVALPLLDPAVLLDFKAHANWPRALSLSVGEAAGLVVLHRQGDRVARHVLPGPLNLPSKGILRILFDWDGPARTWTLATELPEDGDRLCVEGRDPMPMLCDDLLYICQGGSEIMRHKALQWFGVKEGKDMPDRAPWIGPRTPIDTVHGPVAAGQLQPGDLLLTEDGNYAPLISVQKMVLPSRGSFSPVLLRAPYFGAHADILVSNDQIIAMSGDAVEYLFNEETVLTQARHVTDGRTAMIDLRRAATYCVALDLGAPQLIRAEGCRLLTHCNRPLQQTLSPPYAMIQAFEVTPLLAMMGRQRASSAA